VLAASGVAVEGKQIITDTNDPKLVSVEIPLARLPSAWDGLTILQLSDFHYDDHFSVIPIRKAVEIASQLRPDLIVLTGDFVTLPLLHRIFHNSKQAARVVQPCAALLKQLSAPQGVFAVLGNHDVLSDPDFIVENLHMNGIQTLRNQSLPLEREGKRIWLVGLDDALNGDADIEVAMRGVPADEAVVVLVHEPDWARWVSRYPVDLQLSGHSHGGQIVLPLLGAPYLPPLARRFPKGLYRIQRLTLYTNAGIGTIGVPARWNCPPEITLFKLRSVGLAGQEKVSDGR
jgi:uncharacterized protein